MKKGGWVRVGGGKEKSRNAIPGTASHTITGM